MSTSRMSTPSMSTLERPGWLTFAAVVLLSVGILRIITAIAYFADSAKVADLSRGLFGSQLWAWGLWDLVIAVLALWGGWSLLGGNTLGRAIGYIWAGLVLVQSFVILAWAPWFGFLAMALATLVMFALASSSEWREGPSTAPERAARSSRAASAS
jgi:hypothetical protein